MALPMDSDSSKWYPLPSFPNIPTLMISPRFASSSYIFYVTDLANLWVENLDRKGVLLRSLQEDTSIDLSDGDPNQWTILFSKLNAAFDPEAPDHCDTSVNISGSLLDATDKGGFTLHVTCVLPKEFKPLKWPIYLTKCPNSISSELVLPLLQTCRIRTLEMQDLITRLKDKDAVIAKLVAKLEANQIGLEHVFNSLSGKRKSTRQLAEEKVKGLAPFNEGDWRSEVNANRRLPQDISLLLDEAFSVSVLQRKVDTEILPSEQPDDWWTKLGSHVVNAIKPQEELPTSSNNKPPQAAKKTQEKDDDDFQVQTLPPDLQSRRRVLDFEKSTAGTADGENSVVEISVNHSSPSQVKPRSRIRADGERSKVLVNSTSQSSHTIYADDDETPSESDTDPVQPWPQTRPNTRLGTIGKPKGSPPSPTTSSPKPLSPLTLPGDDDETASGSDSGGDDQGPPLVRSSSRAPSPTPRRKVKLGQIGGKSKPRVTPERSEDPGNRHIISSPPKSAGRKIGMIGKKPATDTDTKRQRSGSPSITAAVEPETEEKRTERRRIELTKELERKAAAPTKKKRKF
ncbi:XLF-domain-containing protein [Rostrohypoxylon terebratum]|nr:XLF-domain-containing protein [Rostrohypoxylon terebratum]